jgi:acetyl esterase/lipase
MGAVPYAYLGLAIVGALLVINVYSPIRRDPWSNASFFAGFLTGDLALQLIALEVVVTGVLIDFGALDSWVGWTGLGMALVEWVSLFAVALVGYQAADVVADALRSATGPRLALGPVPPVRWARWWRLTRAVPLRARGVDVTAGIDYWGDGASPHRLDVLSEVGTAAGDGRPVMVYIHGGAWVGGDKRQQGKPMLYELVLAGWVCVTVNYRLSPRSTWPDHIVDCKRALAWVHQHIAAYGGDPTFVAVSGGSAGGHLAALAALTPGDPAFQPGFEALDTSVAACVPFYGVYDMTADETGTGKYGSDLKHLVEKEVMKVDIDGHRRLFEEASPDYRVNPGAPPFFVLHGTHDTLVPVESARRFVGNLRATTLAPVVYAELPLAQHAFDLLATPRCRATTAGVQMFLEALVGRSARPEADGGERTDAARP